MSSSQTIRRVSAALALLCFGVPTRADKLRITSTPSGATVAIDGVILGKTPFEKEYPGGYFHRTKTARGARLEHPLAARITLDGYATKEIPLTYGPMEWISLGGRRQGQYWLFKAKDFDVQLDAIAQTFTGAPSIAASPRTEAPREEAPAPEDFLARTKPAVVYLKSPDKAGTGFLVTATGIIATNAHLARGEESLLVIFSSGQQLEGKVVYVDADLDIALVKVKGRAFPCLTLRRAEQVRQGERVFAVGNPGEAMLFSATSGIVSGIGALPDAGPGTWIQTDAPINPGNSGGPLMNLQGEVIGINTQRLLKKDVRGIALALSAGDLLDVLRRFYPSATPEIEKMATPLTTSVTGNVKKDSGKDFGTLVFAEPEGAEIYVDHDFVGNIPSTIPLPAGVHLIVVRFTGHADWIRRVNILANSNVRLTPFRDGPDR